MDTKIRDERWLASSGGLLRVLLDRRTTSVTFDGSRADYELANRAAANAKPVR